MNTTLLAAKNLKLYLLLFHFWPVLIKLFIKKFPTWKITSIAPQDPLPLGGEEMAKGYL